MQKKLYSVSKKTIITLVNPISDFICIQKNYYYHHHIVFLSSRFVRQRQSVKRKATLSSFKKHPFRVRHKQGWGLSQTLFGNPKEPVELGNPNTCAETKLCLNFILFPLKK